MAEVMVETQESKGINRSCKPTTKNRKPAKDSTLKETPKPGDNDGDDAAEAKQAIHQEQLKAQRDPAKVVIALHNVVRIAIANHLSDLAFGMIERAKKGNTIAMKLLINLCDVVDPDGAGDGSGTGFRISDLLGADFQWKIAMESENPEASEPAGPGIDVVPEVNIAGREAE